MVMEVLPNNPEAPQKGGMAAFDPVLNRNVVIESFYLQGIANHEIRFLNKNVNFYPHPHHTWNMVMYNGLNMPITVKDQCIYFQPVMGDINFMVDTAIFHRQQASPIQAWKSAQTTPLAIRSMHMQDRQKDFIDFAGVFARLPN